MKRQDYVDLLLDHYENPRNRGAAPNATVTMNGGNPGCGDVVTLYVTIDPQTERVSDIHFEGDGCTISQAGVSMIGEAMMGKTVADIEQIGYHIRHRHDGARCRCHSPSLRHTGPIDAQSGDQKAPGDASADVKIR